MSRAARHRPQKAAAEAWAKGRLGGAVARDWLERAARFAPDDPRIGLDLARARLDADDFAAARAAYERLARRYDVATGWMGMALAALRQGDMTGVTTALDVLLTRHVLADEPGSVAFLRQAAAMAGFGAIALTRPDGARVRLGTGRCLGERADELALTRVEGLVTPRADGGLEGWAARPALPDEPPALFLTDATGRRERVRLGRALPADDNAPLLPRYRFRVSARKLAGLVPPFGLAGATGGDIFGSPVDPRALAEPPRRAEARGPLPPAPKPAAGLALVMPAYRGLEETRAALESVLDSAPRGARVLVVDDASPEPGLSAYLAGMAGRGRIELFRHERNQGFCAAVNTALAKAPGHDVVLLNSDILLPPGALETLRDVAYANHATGTVTPLSNEGSLASYPRAQGGNQMPDLAETTRLNGLARAVNGLDAVEVPTGVGFCLFIRHDCQAAVGALRGDLYAQGYGEENDFCLRARQAGFVSVLATGAFVAHRGGVSFRAQARGLMARNLAILERLFPGYQALVAAHFAADPAAGARARLDEARLREAVSGAREVVLMISHSHGGGVARQVRAEMARVRADKGAALLLATEFPADPERTPYPWRARLQAGEADDMPGLSFALETAFDQLMALLRDLGVGRVVLHHTLGHHPRVREIAGALGVAQEIVVHDYGAFCPRVNLLSRPAPTEPPRYCGEPAEAACVACCARDKGGVHERLGVRRLRARTRAEFAAASRVSAPSRDAARRMMRHFPGVTVEATPWEEDALPYELRRPPATGKRRVAVIGGIGPAKGFEVLRDCALDARARGLGLEFVVVGGSSDDERLIEAGVFVTGPYQEGEAQGLIAQLRPDLAFLPSIWPETWCFALTEAWRAGLWPVVFDLGAQGERVRTTGRGLALPLGLPPGRVNDVLLRAGP